MGYSRGIMGYRWDNQFHMIFGWRWEGLEFEKMEFEKLVVGWGEMYSVCLLGVHLHQCAPLGGRWWWAHANLLIMLASLEDIPRYRIHLFIAMTHWFMCSLVHWCVDSLIHCFIDSLVQCFIGLLLHGIIDNGFIAVLIPSSLFHWCIDSLFCWTIDSLIHGYNVSLAHLFIEFLRLIDSLLHSFVDSLIHCFVASLVHRFLDLLIHRFSDLLLRCFIGSQTPWLIWLIWFDLIWLDWLIGFDWLIDWLIDWLTDWRIDWLTDWLIDWLTDWLIDWLTDWLTDWLIDWLIWLDLTWFDCCGGLIWIWFDGLIDSLPRWFIDTMVRSLIHRVLFLWFIQSVVHGFFHVVSLASQPPFAHWVLRFTTSTFRCFCISKTFLYRQSSSCSGFKFSKLPPRHGLALPGKSDYIHWVYKMCTPMIQSRSPRPWASLSSCRSCRGCRAWYIRDLLDVLATWIWTGQKGAMSQGRDPWNWSNPQFLRVLNFWRENIGKSLGNHWM